MHVWLMLNTAPSQRSICIWHLSTSWFLHIQNTRSTNTSVSSQSTRPTFFPSPTTCSTRVADDGDIRLPMSEHPWVPGVNGNSSAHVEGAEHSTQLSLILRVLQNCVSVWKRTVDSYVVVCRAHSSAPHPLVVLR